MKKVEKIDSFTGHRDCVYALERSDETHCFFSAAGDGFVVKWNLKKPDVGEMIAKVAHSVYTMAYLKEKNQLWILENFEGIHIIDIVSKQEVYSLKLFPTNYFAIQIYQDLAFIAGGDGVISIIETKTRSFVKHIKASDKSVRCLSINPLYQEFAAGFSDHSIKIFDLQTFELKKIIQAHQNSVFAIKYSPDFNYLLSGSRDAHLKIWEVGQGYALKKDIVAHIFAINDIDFSPDQKYFATCSMDKSVKIWETNTFKLLQVIDRARHAGHGTSINKLLWVKHENQLLSASDDRTISVWKIKF